MQDPLEWVQASDLFCFFVMELVEKERATLDHLLCLHLPLKKTKPEREQFHCGSSHPPKGYKVNFHWYEFLSYNGDNINWTEYFHSRTYGSCSPLWQDCCMVKNRNKERKKIWTSYYPLFIPSVQEDCCNGYFSRVKIKWSELFLSSIYPVAYDKNINVRYVESVRNPSHPTSRQHTTWLQNLCCSNINKQSLPCCHWGSMSKVAALEVEFNLPVPFHQNSSRRKKKLWSSTKIYQCLQPPSHCRPILESPHQETTDSRRDTKFWPRLACGSE